MQGLSLNRDLDYIADIDKKLIADLYFRHIYERVHTFKFNFLAMMTGKHRTGKSTDAVQISSILDPTFIDNLEKRVVYFPDDFMKALKSITQPASGKPIIGGAIVWDEAGVGMPAREWYDLSNKSISYTLQVFGKYRPIVFFVTQDVSYIDTQARKLFHGFYEAQRMSNQYAMIKPFDVRYNKRSTKVYYVYSRFHLRNDDAIGAKLVLKKIKMQRPPKELEGRYEDHSSIFKDLIKTQMKERVERYSDGILDVKRMTSEEIEKYLVEHKDDTRLLSKRSSEENVIYDANSISFKFEIPARMAAHIKRQAEITVNKVPADKTISE